MNLIDMMLKLLRPSDAFCLGCGHTSSCLDILFIRLQASFSKGIYGADQHREQQDWRGHKMLERKYELAADPQTLEL